MTAKEKCISKWEKRLEKAKRSIEKYGYHYYSAERYTIPVIEETIKDLKRF